MADVQNVLRLARACGYDADLAPNKIVQAHAQRMIDQPGLTSEELELAFELGLEPLCDAELHCLTMVH